MKQDPLITYSSLIPGGLHYIPGGFDQPTHKRIRPTDLPPEPGIRGQMGPSTRHGVFGELPKSGDWQRQKFIVQQRAQEASDRLAPLG